MRHNHLSTLSILSLLGSVESLFACLCKRLTTSLLATRTDFLTRLRCVSVKTQSHTYTATQHVGRWFSMSYVLETFFALVYKAMASSIDHKALLTLLVLGAAAAYVCYKKTMEHFEASDVKWEETAAPYADEYELPGDYPREARASATFGPDAPLITSIPTIDGDSLPFANPTQPMMAYLANGSIASSLPSLRLKVV